MTVTGRYTDICRCGRRVTRHVEAPSEWFAGRRGIHLRCQECGHISFAVRKKDDGQHTDPKYSASFVARPEEAIHFNGGGSV